MSQDEYEYDEYVGHKQDYLDDIYNTTAENVAASDADRELREVLYLQSDIENANITTATGRKINTHRVVARLCHRLTN
jgi:hypothetical protein